VALESYVQVCYTSPSDDNGLSNSAGVCPPPNTAISSRGVSYFAATRTTSSYGNSFDPLLKLLQEVQRIAVKTRTPFVLARTFSGESKREDRKNSEYCLFASFDFLIADGTLGEVGNPPHRSA